MNHNLKEIKSKLNKADRRKLIILFAFWYSAVLFFTVFLTLYWTIKKMDITAGVSFALLIGLFLEIIFLKPKLMYYDMSSRYFRLVYLKRKPFNLKKLTTDKVDKTYKSFYTFVNNNELLVKYAISDSLVKKTFLKTSVLEIVTFIKQPLQEFYGDNLDYIYQQIYKKFEKKYRINKQVIIQFKTFDNINDKILEKIESIICYKEKDNYLITINAGFITCEQKLYCLCSDIYAPNHYYNYGVKLIKKIL